MLRNDKKDNVKAMIKQLGEIYMHLPDSTIKTEFHKFLNMFSSNNITLETIMTVISKKIDNANKVGAVHRENTAKSVVSFWKNIASIVSETYKLNR